MEGKSARGRDTGQGPAWARAVAPPVAHPITIARHVKGSCDYYRSWTPSLTSIVPSRLFLPLSKQQQQGGSEATARKVVWQVKSARKEGAATAERA